MFGVKLIIEVAVVLLLLYGIYREEDIAAWEHELYIVLRQYARRKHHGEKIHH